MKEPSSWGLNKKLLKNLSVRIRFRVIEELGFSLQSFCEY